MTIDEAIGMLNAILEDRKHLKSTIGNRAIQMGIEALKRVREVRFDHRLIAWSKLPGETEEKVRR